MRWIWTVAEQDQNHPHGLKNRPTSAGLVDYAVASMSMLTISVSSRSQVAVDVLVFEAPETLLRHVHGVSPLAPVRLT